MLIGKKIVYLYMFVCMDCDQCSHKNYDSIFYEKKCKLSIDISTFTENLLFIRRHSHIWKCLKVMQKNMSIIHLFFRGLLSHFCSYPLILDIFLWRHTWNFSALPYLFNIVKICIFHENNLESPKTFCNVRSIFTVFFKLRYLGGKALQGM